MVGVVAVAAAVVAVVGSGWVFELGVVELVVVVVGLSVEVVWVVSSSVVVVVLSAEVVVLALALAFDLK